MASFNSILIKLPPNLYKTSMPNLSQVSPPNTSNLNGLLMGVESKSHPLPPLAKHLFISAI